MNNILTKEDIHNLICKCGSKNIEIEETDYNGMPETYIGCLDCNNYIVSGYPSEHVKEMWKILFMSKGEFNDIKN